MIGSIGFLINGTGQIRYLVVLILCALCVGVSVAAEQRQLQLELVLAIHRNKDLVAELEGEQTKLLEANGQLTEAST